MKYSLADDVLTVQGFTRRNASPDELGFKAWERIRTFLEWYEKINLQAQQNYQMVSEKAEAVPFIMNAPEPTDKYGFGVGEKIVVEPTPYVGGRVSISTRAKYLSDVASSYAHELASEVYTDTDIESEKFARRMMALEAVDAEIQRQTELKASGRFKFCVADEGMNDFERLAVLGEEFGEVSHEVNETIGGHRPLDILRIKKELIQVAAVAVAWFERF